MNDKIDETVKRVHRYLYDDGLSEMGVGILFIVVGLGLIAFVAIQDNTVLGAVLLGGLLAFAFGGALFTKRALEAVKERVTYPRTGYVAYPSEKPKKWRWVAPVEILLVVIISLALPEELTRMSAMIGGLMFAIISSLGYRLGLRRFYVLGVIALMVGVGASLLFPNEALGAGMTFTVMGLLLLGSGGLTLSAYPRQNPLAGEV